MSSPVLKPISDCLPILEFFHNKSYAVPPFQRGYAWKSEQITELFDDLLEFIDSGEPVYLLGQVIVTHSLVDGQYILVDGQQRATSLLLLLIAIQKKFRSIPNMLQNGELGYKYGQLDQLIKYYKNGQLYSRVTVSEEGVEYVDSLIRDSQQVKITGWTQQNLHEAYLTAVKFIEENWPQPEDIPAMYERLVQGVHLVRLELPSYDDAVKVFERINNRGLSLSSSDLVKNLLFDIIQNESDRDKISKNWSFTAEKLYTCKNNRIRNMEYLLRSIVIMEKGELVSSLEMRDVWRKIFNNTRYEAMKFADSLPLKATQLKNLDLGKMPNGAKSEFNQSNRYFKTVQHFPMLLIGSHLSEQSFEALAHCVEDRTIVSLIAKERPQNYEKIVPKWGIRIKQLDKNATPQEVIAALTVNDSEWQDLLEVAKTSFRLLSTKKSTEKKRIRYLLARISRKIQRDAMIPALPELDSMLMTTTVLKSADYVGYDLEHIYPISLSNDMKIYDSIGNLVLAHPKDQRDAQNKQPMLKTNVYMSSNLLLTQSLCDEKEFGRSLSYGEQPVLRKIHQIAPPSLGNWNDESILRRFELYWQIFLSDLAIPAK